MRQKILYEMLWPGMRGRPPPDLQKGEQGGRATLGDGSSVEKAVRQELWSRERHNEPRTLDSVKGIHTGFTVLLPSGFSLVNPPGSQMIQGAHCAAQPRPLPAAAPTLGTRQGGRGWRGAVQGQK